MLILLPPSETKTRPAEAGAPALDLTAMALPALHESREMVLRAARRTAEGADAASRLGVPASSPELVQRMAQLAQEPVGAPLTVYSGVLFDQLDPAAALPEDRRVLVQSALFGLVDAAEDAIPAYRLSAGSTLSRLGKAGTWWRPRLKPVAEQLRAEQADGGSPLVIDCRSGSYRSMMSLRSTAEVPVLEVAPVQEKDGVRSVISHDAKRYRGLVTRVLLEAATAPATPEEAREVIATGLAQRGGARGDELGVELDGDRLVVVDRVA